MAVACITRTGVVRLGGAVASGRVPASIAVHAAEVESRWHTPSKIQ